MPRRESRLQVREQAGILLVAFVDRNLLDETVVLEIGAEIDELIEARPAPRLVLSFSNVEHLSSRSLGTLIALHNQIRGRHGQLRLAGMTPEVRQIFEVTRLDRLLAIHGSTDEAVASMV